MGERNGELRDGLSGVNLSHNVETNDHITPSYHAGQLITGKLSEGVMAAPPHPCPNYRTAHLNFLKKISIASRNMYQFMLSDKLDSFCCLSPTFLSPALDAKTTVLLRTAAHFILSYRKKEKIIIMAIYRVKKYTLIATNF